MGFSRLPSHRASRGWFAGRLLTASAILSFAACTSTNSASPPATSTAVESSATPAAAAKEPSLTTAPPTTGPTTTAEPSTTTAVRRVIVNDEPWPMHGIDSRWRGANSLSLGDVNGDGRDDVLTNYEFDQRFAVSFHPGDEGLTEPWPSVDIRLPTEPGRGADTESSSLADLDGDGRLDIVGSQGGHASQFFDGYDPGIRIVWGPDPAQTADPEAWVDAGQFPSTTGAGHFLWQDPADVDGDGDLDVLFGGSEMFDTETPSGIWWLEAPDDKAARRDLAAWVKHPIDPTTTGGHGFVRVDLDGDGDEDLVDANDDFATAEDAEDIRWYEHPDDPRVDQPWPAKVLYRSPDFFPKPQVAVGDLDGDGRPEIVSETDPNLIILTGDAGAGFEAVEVPKPDEIRWPSRMLQLGDLDGDGDLDIAGALTHDDGALPAGLASVFWMENTDGPLETRWRLHVVKWSSGRVMDVPTFGEKWDQGRLHDVDGDGDLDLVANQEEWYVEDNGEVTPFDSPDLDPESVAIVWFENRLFDPVPVCDLSPGSCTIEAELPTTTGDGTWISRNHYPGSEGGYVQSFAGRSTNECPADDDRRSCLVAGPDGVIAIADSTGMTYAVQAGDAVEVDVWARLRIPARFGEHHGGERSDSAWFTLDDGEPLVIDGVGLTADTWSWVKVGESVRLDPGEHSLRLQVRERGLAIDRFIVQPAGSAAP